MAEVRAAGPGDVAAIRRFGETHVRAHYAPLIGTAAQVRDCSTPDRAVADRRRTAAHLALRGQRESRGLTTRNCLTPAVT